MITGAGNLGTALFEYFEINNSYIPFLVSRSLYSSSSKAHGSGKMFKGNICSYEVMERIFLEIEPHILVHTAALTNVDECEREPISAHDVNCKGTQILSQFFLLGNITILYISTDQIFYGTKYVYD